MPKGAHLHLHLTAACKLDIVLELARDDISYYSSTANKIKVFPKGEPEEGYVRYADLRDNWSKEGTFDEFIEKRILLNESDISSKHSSTIWSEFQHKFNLTFHLYNYHKFFERILMSVLEDAINEKVYIVEFRHIFGCVFDDDHKELSFKDEIAIFERCIEKAKKIEPLFE
jgi:hypothetical protein